MNKKLFFLILLPVLFMATLSGQKNNKKIVITGIVTDSKQNPIKGAAIFIDKKQTNVLTNNEGHYKVKVKPTASSISIATSSYGIKDTAIEGRKEINFVFSGDPSSNPVGVKNNSADESVNIGYGSQNKNELGTAVNHVNARKSRYASYSDIYSMLKAEVPGVYVNEGIIRIRGTNSFNTSGMPLLIVDGIMVSTISNISPQMVESVEVLKGASASIYGVRGSNGVILIKLIR
jgi:TonB-dependent SusC/RagA subfamily outer membrane receptor